MDWKKWVRLAFALGRMKVQAAFWAVMGYAEWYIWNATVFFGKNK